MKKLFTVLLVCLLALTTLAGCSKSDGGKEEATVIKIGGSGPLTGGAAIYGLAVKNAAEIAVEEINALGGLQFELNFQDDQHDTEKAVTAYGTLKDWGMQISLYTVTSGPGAAVASYYDEDGIFAITPSGSSTALVYSDTERYENLFQMCFTDPNQGTSAAQYFADHFADAKIAVIYKNDDVYSTGIFDTFTAEAAKLSLNVVYSGTFDDATATDLSTQLAGAQAAEADLLFLPMYYQPASSILIQAANMNYAPKFFGVDGMDGILTMEGFDTKYAEGVYLLTPFAADAEDEKTQNFVKKYEEKYGETPNQFAADAYDCVYAIYEACTAKGITASMTAQEIAAVLTPYFTSEFKFTGVTGSNMTWKENGEVSKLPLAVVITDGVYVSVE